MITAGIEHESAGCGPPVVCLHGIAGGIESFRPQINDAALPRPAERNGGAGPTRRETRTQAIPAGVRHAGSLRGFRVVAWNMPGYGMSIPSKRPPDFRALSSALGRFLTEAGLEPASLVGHSIGGMLALEHALTQPAQVASLVLMGTTPSFGGRDNSFRKAFLEARLAPLDRGTGMAALARAAAPQLVGPDAAANVVAEIESVMKAVKETTWREILECLVTFDRRNDLGRIRQRCCLIAGAHDRNAPPRTMEKMAAKIPRAEYHLVETAGHLINLEEPELTNEIIGRFLRRSIS